MPPDPISDPVCVAEAADEARLYRSMRLVRRAEEVIADIYPSDKIKSPVHLSIGQEAVAVAVCDGLRPDDVVAGSYRGHALYLAKGGDVPAMMAEMFGKIGGCARGKGGSMHLIDPDRTVLGTSAVVGTGIPVAVGHALAFKRRREARVVAAFFGDGATEEGVFHESLNFAALHALPVLFVCENNGLAIHTPLAKRWGAPDLCRRVEGFGVAARRVGDGDIFAMRRAAGEAVARIRAGGGPELLECEVYRWREHVGPNEDYDAGYRSANDAEVWKARDALGVLAARLSSTTRAAIDAEVEAAIADSVAFAEASPFPSADQLTAGVFAD